MFGICSKTLLQLMPCLSDMGSGFMEKTKVDMMDITAHIVWNMSDGTAKQADRVLILSQIITTARTAEQGWMQMINFILGMMLGGAVAVLFLICFRMAERKEK